MKKLIIWATVFTVSLSLLLFVPLSVNAEDFEGLDTNPYSSTSSINFWNYVYLPTMEYLTPNLADNEFYNNYDYYNYSSTNESVRCALMAEDMVKASIKYNQAGYDRGYQDGKADGMTDDFSLKEMIFSIIDAPFRVVREALSFEIFGIEVSSLVLGLLSVVLVIFVIRRLKA